MHNYNASFNKRSCIIKNVESSWKDHNDKCVLQTELQKSIIHSWITADQAEDCLASKLSGCDIALNVHLYSAVSLVSLLC